jgi:curved DNA-binding protein CbpA
MKDPYDTLGLTPSATADEIKAAYRNAARNFHPDRNPTPDAAARFRAAQAAYELLSDPVRRQDHDALRRRNLIDDPLVEATALWTSYLERVTT